MSSMKRIKTIAAVAALTLLAGCTTLSIDLPALTDAPTNSRSEGRIIWHDLLTQDIEASKAFYQGLFGWEFERIPFSLGFGRSSDYLLIRNQGRLVGGMFDTSASRRDVNNSQWVAVMSVADVDKGVAAVTAAGGRTLTPPTDLKDRGRIAVVEDPAGALFAVLETRDGDPALPKARPGDFLWDEVWTSDIDEAKAFYSNLADFEPFSVGAGERQYQALQINGEPSFGMLLEPLEGLKPTWASYIRVDDMSVLDRVEALGGEIIIPAQPRDLGGEVAVIAGPSGAGIVLQTWPDESE